MKLIRFKLFIDVKLLKLFTKHPNEVG